MKASFSTEELKTRRGQFVARLRKAQLPVAVLWQPASVCYFTGNEIAGANAIILDADDRYIVICDEYDAYNFHPLNDTLEIRPYPYVGNLFAYVADCVRELGWANESVGIEERNLAHDSRIMLERHLPRIRLVSVDDLVGAVRLVKSALELTYIRQAASAVQEAFRAVADALAHNITERELAQITYRELIAAGSDYVASQPYVKSGPRAFLTHARWSDRQVAPTDHVLLEIGACVHRYHAALMRSRLQQNATRAYRRAVDAVVSGRDAYLQALRPGVTANELHAAYLSALDRHGVQSWNRHGSGYSLGIAFPPYWGELAHLVLIKGVTTQLERNMVLHVISGLTAPDVGVPHIGLSECVVVTETGCERLIEMEDFLCP